eukprot:4254262-Amphidinium_carterae.1
MADKVQRLIEEDPEELFLQVDVENAFSSASRLSTLEALTECCPRLAQSQFAWLCEPACAVITGAD